MANSERKTFVLKCDKPRYDGGVEIDLEQYFGKRLQPEMSSLKKLAMSHLDKEKACGATPTKTKEAIKRLKLHPEIEEALLNDEPYHFDLDDAVRLGFADEHLPTLETSLTPLKSSAPTHEKALRGMAKKPLRERLKEVMMEGPLQVAVGMTGLTTSILAFSSMRFSRNPASLKTQAVKLFNDCSKVLLSGIWHTFILPCKAIRAIMI